MIVGWRAWFVDVPEQHDLVRYDSESCSFNNLPKDGCLGLAQYEDALKPDGRHKRILLNGYDYYFKAGEIYGVDIDSREHNAVEDINARYINPIIIRGIWTTNDLIMKMHAEMSEAQWP